MSSTSGITGTGLKKCMPRNRERRSPATASARRWIAIELVFEAKIALGEATRSMSRHSACLTARSSNTASMTRSASPTRSSRSVASTRRSASAAASAVSLPLATERSRLPSIRVRPASARERSGSYRTTVLPIAACTCAMPWPMRPAPATKTRSIVVTSAMVPGLVSKVRRARLSAHSPHPVAQQPVGGRVRIEPMFRHFDQQGVGGGPALRRAKL